VADARRGVDRTWLHRRFDAIDGPDYDGAHDDGDFEYTWDNFVDVQVFYDRAAAYEAFLRGASLPGRERG
jgi:hypothetical protein